MPIVIITFQFQENILFSIFKTKTAKSKRKHIELLHKIIFHRWLSYNTYMMRYFTKTKQQTFYSTLNRKWNTRNLVCLQFRGF